MGQEEKVAKKTSLYDFHTESGAKIIRFGEWLMPLNYSLGVVKEHRNVRESAGLFDVSHMGELRITGGDAQRFLQHVTINNIAALKDGMGQYTAMVKADGGMIDDLILYRIGENDFLLCVNAANIDKDYSWLKKNLGGFDCSLENQSELFSQIAVQGPKSFETLRAILPDGQDERIAGLDYMGIAELEINQAQVFIARTGYTGEKGYEIYLPNQVVRELWESMLTTKEKTQVEPIGLGARDTLRLEACYLLYGSDMDETVSPLEAGIGWALKLDAKDFIGKQVLMEQKLKGPNRRTYGFKLSEPGVARGGDEGLSGRSRDRDRDKRLLSSLLKLFWRYGSDSIGDR